VVEFPFVGSREHAANHFKMSDKYVDGVAIRGVKRSIRVNKEFVMICTIRETHKELSIARR